MSFLATCSKSLADLPPNLKPNAKDGLPLVCLNRAEAERAQIAILENQSCHDQLKSANSNPDWVSATLIGAGALILGIVIGQTVH